MKGGEAPLVQLPLGSHRNLPNRQIGPERICQLTESSGELVIPPVPALEQPSQKGIGDAPAESYRPAVPAVRGGRTPYLSAKVIWCRGKTPTLFVDTVAPQQRWWTRCYRGCRGPDLPGRY